METKESREIKGGKKSGDLGINKEVLSLAENGQLMSLIVLFIIGLLNLFFVSGSLLHLTHFFYFTIPSLPILSSLPSFHYSLKLKPMWGITQSVGSQHKPKESNTPKGAGRVQDKAKKEVFGQVGLPVNIIFTNARGGQLAQQTYDMSVSNRYSSLSMLLVCF